MNRKIIVLDKPGKKELVVPLKREGEEVEVLGLVLGKKKGEYELKIVVDHRARKTKGRVLVKGIAENGVKIRVDGLIKTAKEAQKVDDFLEMRMLVLDDKSQVVMEPKLEIEANEVKVAHAATVSKINEDQLFYLTSMGLNKQQAEALIIKGFLREIIDKITNSKDEP